MREQQSSIDSQSIKPLQEVFLSLQMGKNKNKNGVKKRARETEPMFVFF
jgi:hypothetical protein